MPLRYRIFPDLALVHSEAYGVVTGAENVAHAMALAADPCFVPTYAQFVDLRAITEFAADAAEMRRLADENPFDRSARRLALVGTPVAYGMLRMYQLLTDIEEHTLVTRSEEEAWAFVGHSPDAVRRPSCSSWDSAARS